MEKNYQIWHHRRCVFEMWARFIAKAENTTTDNLRNVSDVSYVFDVEFEFLKEIFVSDSKNYHAWSHVIWLVERY